MIMIKKGLWYIAECTWTNENIDDAISYICVARH